MSTYWGYVCESHDPPLVSEHWINHGADLLAEVFWLERRGEWPDEPPPFPEWEPDPEPVRWGADNSGTASPVYWLRRHPHCRVALHNEYGETREIMSEATK